MSESWKLGVILAFLFAGAVFPVNAHGPLFVSISPGSQAAAQASQASYSVSFSGGLLGATYVFRISGLPYGTSYYFSPSSVSAISGSSILVIGTSDIGGAYCPGSYVFTVSVTNQRSASDYGSASASLLVAQVGPPLLVSVSTNKPAYVQGDKITLQVTVNRPAKGTISVTPPGGSPTTYTFATLSSAGATRTITASQPYGTYTVTVTADDYCNSYNTASTTFTVGPNTYSVLVQLSGVPQQYSATLQVDGQKEGTVPGSQTKTLSFKIGSTHTIMVDQYVSGATGVRYYCPQNSLSVSSAGSYTFNYQTQYQLTIATDPPSVAQVGNGGWYNAGASVQTGQAPQTVPGSAGVQYVFNTWVVDGAAQGGAQITFAMNGPHKATAKYTTQYLLTVDSPNGLGNPQGGGYHDAGSTAHFSVSSPVGYLVQQVFVQWKGDYTGTSPQGSITMNTPKTVYAVWTTSYTNAYIAAGVVVVVVALGAILAMRRRAHKTAGKEMDEKEGKREPSGERPRKSPSSKRSAE